MILRYNVTNNEGNDDMSTESKTKRSLTVTWRLIYSWFRVMEATQGACKAFVADFNEVTKGKTTDKTVSKAFAALVLGPKYARLCSSLPAREDRLMNMLRATQHIVSNTKYPESIPEALKDVKWTPHNRELTKTELDQVTSTLRYYDAGVPGQLEVELARKKKMEAAQQAEAARAKLPVQTTLSLEATTTATTTATPTTQEFGSAFLFKRILSVLEEMSAKQDATNNKLAELNQTVSDMKAATSEFQFSPRVASGG
jgi:hypothetical protein